MNEPSGIESGHSLSIRLAKREDLPVLRELIPESVRRLSQGYYSLVQIESAIRHVFGPDTQLISDGTYFVAEIENRIVGCGGWSQRSTLYGGDQMKSATDPLLDPLTTAGRIRAFFVHPNWARQGIGREILAACLSAMHSAGFSRAELVATLPGEPLYQAYGFEVAERLNITLPDGVPIAFVRMVFEWKDAPGLIRSRINLLPNPRA